MYENLWVCSKTIDIAYVFDTYNFFHGIHHAWIEVRFLAICTKHGLKSYFLQFAPKNQEATFNLPRNIGPFLVKIRTMHML